MNKIFLFIFISACHINIFGQVILGSDPAQEIKVTTSSNYAPQYWTLSATGDKTINNTGLEGKLMEASRFLSQATLGADLATIQYVADIGMEKWIEEQMQLPPSQIHETLESVFAEALEWYLLNGGDPEEIATRPYWTHFNYSWWENHMNSSDLLRQRVALALSEIFVISFQSSF